MVQNLQPRQKKPHLYSLSIIADVIGTHPQSVLYLISLGTSHDAYIIIIISADYEEQVCRLDLCCRNNDERNQQLQVHIQHIEKDNENIAIELMVK